jgi:hypothetical protein
MILCIVSGKNLKLLHPEKKIDESLLCYSYVRIRLRNYLYTLLVFHFYNVNTYDEYYTKVKSKWRVNSDI